MDNRISRNTPPPAPSPRAALPNQLTERPVQGLARATGSEPESGTSSTAPDVLVQRRAAPENDESAAASRQVRARMDRERALPRMMPPAPAPARGIEQWRVLAQHQAWSQEARTAPELGFGADLPDLPGLLVSSAASTRAALKKATVIQQWQAWAATAPVSPKEQRAEALRRVIACYDNSNNKVDSARLDLGGLSLIGTMPSFPGHLTHIDISNNDIDTIQPFPKPCQLQELDVSANLISFLPLIPSSLQKLDASNCDLQRLLPFPQGGALRELKLCLNESLRALPPIPSSLQELDASYCDLQQPPHLPENSQLKTLNLHSNDELNTLPQLPLCLEKLDIGHCSVERLPPLPPNLTELRASECSLTMLPRMPLGIKIAELDDNAIQDLSQAAPNTLERLDLSNNPINGLPEWLFQLGSETEVSVSLGHMTNDARQAIVNRIGAAQSSNVGPRITFDMGVPSDQNLPERPLNEAAAAWFPGGAAQAQQTPWASFANEEGAQAFANFLDRLGQTTNHVDPSTREPFRRGVQQLLNEMQASPALRADCFATCVGATASCEDRVTLSYQNMAVARLTDAVRRGEFNNDAALPGFIDQARSLYRRDVLTDIASRQVKTMRMVDPIEVHLAYQVKLNEQLGLQLDATQMRFYDASGVSEADLQAARLEVQQREDQGFASHLMNHSGPWALLMQQRAPELHAQMMEAKVQAIEQLPQAIDDHLAQHGLPSDADTVRAVGRTVSDELTFQAQKPFVAQFLNKHATSADALLGPRWPSA